MRRSAKLIKHGTVSSYTNYNCRCDECKSAASTYRKKQAESRRVEKRKLEERKRARALKKSAVMTGTMRDAATLLQDGVSHSFNIPAMLRIAATTIDDLRDRLMVLEKEAARIHPRGACDGEPEVVSAL